MPPKKKQNNSDAPKPPPRRSQRNKAAATAAPTTGASGAGTLGAGTSTSGVSNAGVSKPKHKLKLYPKAAQARTAAIQAAAAAARATSPEAPTGHQAPSTPTGAKATATAPTAPGSYVPSNPTINPLIPPQHLGTTSHKVIFLYGPNKAKRKNRRLTVLLTVFPCESPEIKSRLRYNAHFWLGDTQVGQINAWRIDKATASAPNAKAAWIQDYLTPKFSTLQGWTAETSLLLRAIFTRADRVRPAVRALREELDDRGLMVISLVHTEASHQKRGLLRPMLQAFRHMLGTLPEWLCFDGVRVLTPGRLNDEKGDVWGDETDDVVEATLRGMYEGSDGYRWCGDLRAQGCVVVVLGRLVG